MTVNSQPFFFLREVNDVSSKIPVVVADGGGYEQLQPGDTLAATLTPDPAAPPLPHFCFPTRSLDFGIIRRGQVCAVQTSGSGVIRAVAGNALAAGVGLAALQIDPGQNSWVQCGGLFTLDDWTQVVGFRQLFSSSNYYLDAAFPGQLTRTPPAKVGDYLQLIGVAMTPNILLLTVGAAILL